MLPPPLSTSMAYQTSRSNSPTPPSGTTGHESSIGGLEKGKRKVPFELVLWLPVKGGATLTCAGCGCIHRNGFTGNAKLLCSESGFSRMDGEPRLISKEL
jgi:hypothetical protein